MGFYNIASLTNKQYYHRLLEMMGGLSNLFSSSDKPYIDSRVAENLFCRCLEAQNLARNDCTADAKKNKIGIGIKTWIASKGMQKIAEFNRLKKDYNGLKGIELAGKISQLRNARINFTMRTHDINEMIYHCIIRDVGNINIAECSMDLIDCTKLQILTQKDHTMTFTDGWNEYGFNDSKSVLLKRFNKMEVLKTIPVSIIEDPYQVLEQTLCNKSYNNDFNSIITEKTIKYPHIYLKLYSYKGKERFVPEKSGLNQWNAAGRTRDPDELYIPISREDHRKAPDFLPQRDTPFSLKLPNGEIICAKVCQQDSKALMSNPNKLLGKWLLRDVFNLKKQELLTYDMFEKVGVDSVLIQKINNGLYSIDFAKINSYEEFMGHDELGQLDDSE